MANYPLMVSGGEASGSLAVTSPYDGEHIADVETGNLQHVEAALATAHELFRDRTKWLSVPRRIEILEATAELMKQRADELANLAASEGGKPLPDSS